MKPQISPTKLRKFLRKLYTQLDKAQDDIDALRIDKANERLGAMLEDVGDHLLFLSYAVPDKPIPKPSAKQLKAAYKKAHPRA